MIINNNKKYVSLDKLSLYDEKIKKFRLIKRGFTIESGELTSTLKLRRAVILQNYAAMIEEMYNPVQGPLGGYVK